MIKHIVEAIKPLLEIVFPNRCPFCQQQADNDRSDNICNSCCHNLMVEFANQCRRCGAAVGPYANTSKGCTHCRKRTLRFDSVTCLGMYDDFMRKVILSGKWSYSSTILRRLAALLAEQHFDTLKRLSADVIIPIPQHLFGRFEKNFNSAAIIGHELGHRLSLTCDEHILRRQRRTKTQKRISAAARFENQKDSYLLRDQHLISGQNILLVDDVMTTGATCSEAARTLKSAGAKRVHVALLARVLNAPTPPSTNPAPVTPETKSSLKSPI